MSETRREFVDGAAPATIKSAAFYNLLRSLRYGGLLTSMRHTVRVTPTGGVSEQTGDV